MLNLQINDNLKTLPSVSGRVQDFKVLTKFKLKAIFRSEGFSDEDKIFIQMAEFPWQSSNVRRIKMLLTVKILTVKIIRMLVMFLLGGK